VNRSGGFGIYGETAISNSLRHTVLFLPCEVPQHLADSATNYVRGNIHAISETLFVLELEYGTNSAMRTTLDGVPTRRPCGDDF